MDNEDTFMLTAIKLLFWGVLTVNLMVFIYTLAKLDATVNLCKLDLSKCELIKQKK